MKYPILIVLLFLTSSAVTDGESIAIINARIYTMTGPTIDKGTVLIRDGKIEAVGTDITIPENSKTLDAAGKIVLPGFIDANCHVGLAEISLVPATVDTSESTDPITPQLLVTDAFFPESAAIGVTRSNGVTSGIVSPGDINVITGVSALISFSGKQINQIILRPRVSVNATLGEPPKETYGSQNKMPMTRMGTAALLRETLQKAKEYGEKWKRYREKSKAKTPKVKNNKPLEPPERDLKLEALQEVLSGELPLVVSAHRVDDILTAIRIAEEFDLKKNLVLNHGTEAYKVADLLAREGIPVLVGPITTQPERIETLGATYSNAQVLQKAGVVIAIQSNETHNARNLPYEAALAVASGLPYEEALKAITLNPAKIFRISDQLGSIEEGKRADLIVANGDPLEPRTQITNVFIAGEEIPNANYHKELWEQFTKKP